jgi:RNA polymerase sigma-70 factor (ECF subfamily)
VETASTQTGRLEGELALERPQTVAADALVVELWREAEADRCGLTVEEFAAVLAAVGAKHQFGQAPGTVADAAQRAGFWRGLRLAELALAQGCALGRDAAWERFLAQFRGPLTQAAIGITGSATAGHDLADSLYSELFGLTERDGVRRSPLGSYSGRGSLMGWLRTTLAQRHVDHHRKTYRETPLPEVEPAAPVAAAPIEVTELSRAVERTLVGLGAEERFLLAAYFLDQRTLKEIGLLLRVHEATISRRLARLTSDVRKQLLRQLQSGGMSRRAAEEALGADPRDVEVNLRGLLQSMDGSSFQAQPERKAR